MFDFSLIAGPEDSKQENFSALCTCLLMRIYPQAKPVEGRGGDEGVNAFVGNINGSLQIFQYKYSIGPLRTTQKRHIVASLDKATSHHHPISWTLTIPKDLTLAEQRWFNSLQVKYPHVKLDWWGKTKLIELLAKHQDLAAAFQPARPLTLVILDPDRSASDILPDILLTQKMSALGFNNAQQMTPAVQLKLSLSAPRSNLRILVWGPGESAKELYAKRVEIRDRLRKLGHTAFFSEELISTGGLCAGGLNLTIEEYLQAKSFDYIVCLMASPGSIGEVHDFAKKRALASKMMVCVDETHRASYSQGALRIFEGFNGKLDWFKSPDDLLHCHLATRVLEQVEKTVEAKTWELLEGAN